MPTPGTDPAAYYSWHSTQRHARSVDLPTPFPPRPATFSDPRSIGRALVRSHLTPRTTAAIPQPSQPTLQ
ncbi:hypothetical protein PYCCODRAFT_1434643 [Trametes coccinea BRFM310]|uniref:Uncharacterized protein n=1 Tax=Trametes coccinea (strain BRFM310) TaxID=1353009 RepID=A0A1Y2IQ62_TRAC3|nr:hypothetical protein PYCCODRAFT_1434643 [Trametes coccinea BRFM310]